MTADFLLKCKITRLLTIKNPVNICRENVNKWYQTTLFPNKFPATKKYKLWMGLQCVTCGGPNARQISVRIPFRENWLIKMKSSWVKKFSKDRLKTKRVNVAKRNNK